VKTKKALAAAQPMTKAAFRAAAGVSRETLGRLETYASLLRAWQKAVNLVGPGTIPDLWRRHMLDSAQLLEYFPPDPGPDTRVIADLGSGAGFPGLVLAILGAGRVHLIESDRRKCAFLAEVARATGTEVAIHPVRAEEIGRELPFGRADVITARALAPLSALLALAVPILKPDGVCLFLKGEHVDEELTAATKEWNMRVERWPSATAEAGAVLRIGGISLGKSSH
jgi:16S rRNA (guanine527-N7)-methyltransferase